MCAVVSIDCVSNGIYNKTFGYMRVLFVLRAYRWVYLIIIFSLYNCNFVIIRKNAHLMPILDKGCNIGGSLACLNSGKCLSTGFCECKTGFLGATCAQREF